MVNRQTLLLQGISISTTVASNGPGRATAVPPFKPRLRLQCHLRASSSASSMSTGATRSNPAMNFPCLDANELRAQRIAKEKGISITFGETASKQSPSVYSPEASTSAGEITEAQTISDVEASGPEPAYSNVVSGYKLYHHSQSLELDYGGALPEFNIAYETWGEMNVEKDNVILLHTGLSASSHAHSTPDNPSEGWWEKFIGPGKAIDTNRFFVICTNVLGGCYGSSGPSSLDPADGKPYATRFPILSIFDMVRAQFLLLDSLGVEKLYASVGSSMGGMQSIAAAHLEPRRVGKVVSISGSARSSPSSIALRYAQRSGMCHFMNNNRMRRSLNFVLGSTDVRS